MEEARKLGIDKVFHIDSKSPSKNTAIKIGEQIGDYPRLTFDCRGSQLTSQIAIDVSPFLITLIFLDIPNTLLNR